MQWYICILVNDDHAFEKLTKSIHIHLNMIAITWRKKQMKDNE